MSLFMSAERFSDDVSRATFAPQAPLVLVPEPLESMAINASRRHRRDLFSVRSSIARNTLGRPAPADYYDCTTGLNITLAGFFFLQSGINGKMFASRGMFGRNAIRHVANLSRDNTNFVRVLLVQLNTFGS